MAQQSQNPLRLLGKLTSSSKNFDEASAKCMALYRVFMRCAPAITQRYQLDVPPSLVRTAIRNEFAKHKEEKNIRTLDMLYMRGCQELEETLMMWKVKAHVMRYIQPYENVSMGFLKRENIADALKQGPTATDLQKLHRMKELRAQTMLAMLAENDPEREKLIVEMRSEGFAIPGEKKTPKIAQHTNDHHDHHDHHGHGHGHHH
eukprot:comp18450_c0_seq1/m.33022 comp18450_c0_seq1/g.33022  ORF comp18450_c0_seq1/g.33022 comp18450_c0_seq1/m.33022 type:complete len:204 (-) comp18450_c0_seq1:61-672(-)